MTGNSVHNRTTKDTILGYSHVSVENAPGRAKLVRLPLQTAPVVMGVRDEVAEHYNLSDGDFTPKTTTLDYLVGAVAACLTGTFGGRLAAIGQTISGGALLTEATGELVVTNGVIRVHSIDVRYTIVLTDGVDEARVHRAHETHTRFCPVAMSVKDSIEITTHVTIN